MKQDYLSLLLAELFWKIVQAYLFAYLCSQVIRFRCCRASAWLPIQYFSWDQPWLALAAFRYYMSSVWPPIQYFSWDQPWVAVAAFGYCRPSVWPPIQYFSWGINPELLLLPSGTAGLQCDLQYSTLVGINTELLLLPSGTAGLQCIKRCNGRRDGWTDRRTDRSVLRAAWSQLKMLEL